MEFLFGISSGTWRSLARFGGYGIGFGEVPERHSTTEPLFDLIEKHKDEDIVVEFRLENYARGLK